MDLVEKAKQYRLDIVGISSTQRCGSGTVNLDGGWKLFCSGADPKMSAHADVGIRLCVRMDSFGIAGLYVATHCAKQSITLVSGVCS